MITKMDEVLAAIAAGKSNTQIRDEVDRRLSDKSINKLRAHPANADVPWPEDARQAEAAGAVAEAPEGARSATMSEQTGGLPACTLAPQAVSGGGLRWPEGVTCKRITYELQMDEAWSLITDGEHAKLKCQENTVISLPTDELLKLTDRLYAVLCAVCGR